MDLLKVIENASRCSSIVFTNGCFDIIHLGHIKLLKEISQLGFLIIGLNSDKSIKSLEDNKKKFRPINNEIDRKEVLKAIRYVGHVELFDEPTPIDLIKKVKPNILVKGGDWEIDNIVGKEFVESYGGEVTNIKLAPGKSTTDIIARCWLYTERYNEYMVRKRE